MPTDRSEILPVDICRANHPTSWGITCQLEDDHFGEHVRDCFSQYTVRWQDPCECDSHTGVGDDLWKCDECGEVIRYVDDPGGRIVLTTLSPPSRRVVRVEMVTPGTRRDRVVFTVPGPADSDPDAGAKKALESERPGNREWWT